MLELIMMIFLAMSNSEFHAHHTASLVRLGCPARSDSCPIRVTVD